MSSKNKRKNLASGFAVNLAGFADRPLPSADLLAKAAALAEPVKPALQAEPERVLSVVELAPEVAAQSEAADLAPAITEEPAPAVAEVKAVPVVSEAVPAEESAELSPAPAPVAPVKKAARTKEPAPKTLVGTGTMLRRAATEEYARLALNISPDLHRRLKLACVKEGMSLSHAGEVALAAYLESLGH